jgi:hypothetical protein
VEFSDFIANRISKIRISNVMIDEIVKGKYKSDIPLQIKKCETIKESNDVIFY